MSDTEGKVRNLSSISSEDAIMLLSRLYRIDSLLHREPQNAKERLCHEVLLITQGRAQLNLFARESREPMFACSSLRHYPVKHQERIYGFLEIISSPERSSPEFSPQFAEVLAATCAILLHTVEMSTIVKEECQKMNLQAVQSLTKQQQQVLSLICQQYSTPKIAEQLKIAIKTVGTHKHNIYSKLNVNNEHEARLAAFCAGFSSQLDR